MPMQLSDAARSRWTVVAVLCGAGALTFFVGKAFLVRPAAGGGNAIDGPGVGRVEAAPAPAEPETPKAAPVLSAAERKRAAREARRPATAAGTAAPVFFEFAGRVVDEEGAPIPDAEVALVLTTTDPFDFAAPRLATATSDKDGAFRVERVDGSYRYRAEIRHRAYAASLGHEVEAHEPGAVTREFTLTRGASIEGTVTADGAPVAGAVVRVVDVLRKGAEETGPVERECVTDAAGRFSAGGIAPRGKFLQVDAPGFAPVRLGPVRAAAGTPPQVPVRLVPGKPLRGRAILDDGEGRLSPLARGRITARVLAPAPGAAPPPGYAPTSVETDASGGFAFPALPDALYVLMVRPEIGPEVAVEPVPPADAPAGSPPPQVRPGGDPLELRLRRSGVGRLVGRAFDLQTGEPLRRFFAWPSRVNDPSGQSAAGRYFDAPDGAFALDVEPGPAWFVVVEAEGLPPTPAGPFLVEPGRVTSGADVGCTPGVVVRGRVIDDAGKPLVGAVVAARTGSRPENASAEADFAGPSADVRGPRAPARAETAKDGTFEFRVARGSWKLLVTHEDALELRTDVVGCHVDATVGDLVLRRAASIYGTVTAAGGGPDAGAAVLVAREPAPERPKPLGATTAEDGTYRVGGLEPGTYRVRISQRELRTVLGTPESVAFVVHVGPGERVRQDF